MRRFWLALLVAGVLLRIAAPFAMDVWEDGGEYAAMGHALAARGDLWLPSGEDRVPGGSTGEPGHSRHYPPAWPAVLAAGYAVLGFGLWQTKVVALATALVAIAVAYACTRDLYGPDKALIVGALVAVEDQLLWATGRGYSENLVLVFFTLTLWAIVRSLKDERFVLLAGLFAGLAYLTRASMGPFFLVAGIGGFAWRLRHRGWRGVASPWYLGAAGLFAAMVLAWAARNQALHGSPTTSLHMSTATAHALANPGALLVGLGAKLLLFSAFAAVFVLPLGRELRAAARRAREEETSALWLAAGLVFVLGWLLTALLWTYEGYTPFFLENQRYVVVALVPLAWLAVREMRDAKGLATLGVVLLLASAATIASPMRDAEARGAELLRPHLEPGDRIAVVWMSTYSLYPYLGDLDVALRPMTRIADERPEFVIATIAADPEGYGLAWMVEPRTLFRGEYPAYVYARLDVLAERGLPSSSVVATW